MVDKNDWRIVNQEKYLMGKTLYFKKYKQPSKEWDHDHCTFCTQKIMDANIPDVEREGYTTDDEYYWICKECFHDFKDMFQWKVKYGL